MDTEAPVRRYLPAALWAIAILAVYLVITQLIAPFSAGISLNGKVVARTLQEIGGFLIGILAGLGLIEVYVYQWFFRQPQALPQKIVVRTIQIALAVVMLMTATVFLETTDLVRLGDGPIAGFLRMPGAQFDALVKALTGVEAVGKGNANAVAGLFLVVVLGALFGLIHVLTKPRHTRVGLAYLLVTPAFLGVLFLIIYPFLYEIKLAFSNAALGTQATKNALYGLEYGLENLRQLFTGTVAQDAKFFAVFLRTVLWTAINVTCHVAGGMGLALLLHRPMKLQGVYRTFLIVPWAIPTTIAAMSLRNEFDSRYGLFNILLGNIHDFIVSLGPMFEWLQVIGPVSWKQDPFWAFVSIVISNVWLGIPFMSVIILGGLQSISQEYYEAAEIDGANKWHQFRNITLPMLRPVLTPAIILGTVWTFNKFDVIYLITQGGPQEKTDILVSSMYKAAFQFYRYGFTAMFALVIFIFLFIFTLFYLRMSGGLKSIYD